MLLQLTSQIITFCPSSYTMVMHEMIVTVLKQFLLCVCLQYKSHRPPPSVCCQEGLLLDTSFEGWVYDFYIYKLQQFLLVSLVAVWPPTTISLSPGRTVTIHWYQGVGMMLAISQELVSMLCTQMMLVALSHESFPPTTGSCPFSVTHVEHLTGKSAIVCQTEFSFMKYFFNLCSYGSLRGHSASRSEPSSDLAP